MKAENVDENSLKCGFLPAELNKRFFLDRIRMSRRKRQGNQSENGFSKFFILLIFLVFYSHQLVHIFAFR